MTELNIENPVTTEKPKATLNIDPVAKPEGKPSRAARIPQPKVAQKEEPETSKWIKLVKGGTYGYKRAIYEQGKTYEVDLPTAEHLLSQFYTVGGNGQESVDVYYFQEVPKKKK